MTRITEDIWGSKNMPSLAEAMKKEHAFLAGEADIICGWRWSRGCEAALAAARLGAESFFLR